ncbi:MAG: T9SS type A sorting domain-containing protein [Cyclobacteriaceae bacterium]
MKSFYYRCVSAALLLLSITLTYGQCPADETDFSNGGTFSGTCTVDYGSTATITGDVVITGGDFNISEMWQGLFIANGGSLTIQGGTITLDDDDGFNDAFLQVLSGGTFTMTGGTMNVETNILIEGVADIQSGATLNSTTGDGRLSVESTGTLTVAGTIDVQGTGGLSGDIYVNGNMTIQNGGDVSTQDAVKVINGGTLTVDDGGMLDVGTNLLNNFQGNNGGAASQGSIINNGTITAGGNVIINDTSPDSGLSGTGDLDVTGTLTDNEGGAFEACPQFPCDAELILQIQNAPTAVNSTSAFSVTILFGQSVTGFALGDISVGNGAAGNLAGSGDTYTVDITPTGAGNITLDIAADVVPEMNYAASQVTVTFDASQPTVTISNEPGSAPSSTPFSITITFNENIDNTTFALGDITVTNGTVSNLAETVATTTYTVDITPDNVGDVGVSIAAGTVTDLATNTNIASNSISVPLVLGPGDVMITGYSTQTSGTTLGDGIAFVALVDIPANQVIYFSDVEWDDANTVWDNADNVSSTDTYYTWTNDNAVLPAGSMVVFYGTASQVFTTTGGGSTTSEAVQEIGVDSGNTNEVIYAYTANSSNNPASTVFLSALATDGFDGFGGGVGFERGDLPSSLTIGTTAIEFIADEDLTIYNGPATCNGTLVECQQQIADTDNWITVGSSGDDTDSSGGSGGGTAAWPPVDGPVGSGGGLGGTALPVELLSFKGALFEGQQIAQLSWVTGTEINNEGFYVEKSIDGIDFEEIGFVEGNGNTTDIKEYNFLDYNIEISSYYRLRQVDYDGQFELSNLIFVSLVDLRNEDPIRIFPNPTLKEINIEGLIDELYDILVLDVSGKQLLSLPKTNLRDAVGLINQMLISRESGLYLIKFVNPGHTETIRLVKK